MSGGAAREPQLIDAFPLSPLQQGMLFHSLYAPHDGIYVEQRWCSLEGPLDRVAFMRSWQAAVDRHAVLRTEFHWQDMEQPLQAVYDTVELPWQIEDWRTLSDNGRAERLEQRLTEDRVRGFELDRAPLMRCHLIRMTEESHRFVWTYHHLLMDGWCNGLLIHEVMRNYLGHREGLTTERPPAQDYRRYIDWLSQRPARADEAYWSATLSGVAMPTRLDLPFDPVASGDRDDGESSLTERPIAGYAVHEARLSAELSAALERSAREQHLTVNTLFQGALAMLLGRYVDADDILFGATIAGRPPELDDVDSILGLFINTVPVRADVAPARPLQALLRELQDEQRRREQHGYLPLAELQRKAGIDAGERLFDTLLVYENYPVSLDAALGSLDLGLTLTDTGGYERTDFPLTLIVVPGERYALSARFETRYLDASAVRRLCGQLEVLLGAMINRPEARIDELPLLSADERRDLARREWGPAQPLGETSIPRRLDVQAARTPDRTALHARVDAGGAYQALSYAEMARAVRRLARILAAQGVVRGTRVGVMLGRTQQLPVALLAVLEAGGTYVPLDPAYPPERLRFMADDAGIELLLHNGQGDRLQNDLGGAVRGLDLAPGVVPAVAGSDTPATLPTLGEDDLAYIIYTSGSTGMPKGVPITHGGLANFINAMQAAPGFDTTDILLAVTTVAFDIAALELFVPLTVGACVVLSGSDEARDAEALADLIEAYDVNVMQASPSTWRLLIASGWPGRSELRMLCGGEALDPSLASALLERGGVLWNLYGPTETTIWSAALAVDPTMAAGDRIPIGGPIANTQLRVVDRHQRPVPVGVAGELLIGGAGVSPGYWERPALTAERFLAAAAGEHSRGASVLYRTGDRVRWRADGTLQFLGRDDLQIKLRGHRIELGEIEAVLNAHEAVEQAAVSVHKDRHGDSRLVAFVVTRSQTDDRRLRAALRERLPEPMVPARIERLDALPMTLNGKLDREALAGISVAQDDEGNADRNDGAADTVRTPATELVASAWCEVLAIGRVSARDNFFELGGHSLTAIRLATRLGLLLGRDVPLRLLFDHPRFDEQVAALERLTSEVQLDPIPLLARDGRPIPLSPAQRRQWLLAGLMPDNPMYGIPTAVRLEGRVEVPALRDSLERLTLRHETLRTEFRERDGTPYAFINDAPTVTLNEVDLNGSATTIDAWLRAEAARPIALDRAPLWRVSLITDVDGSQVLTVVMHHILADGWSLGVFVRELAASYAAWPDPAPLPPLPVQYADFAAWSDAADHGPSLDYWAQALADLAPELSLPTDFPHPAEPSYVGATQHFTVDGVTRDRLIALGRREGSTLFMTLLSAFALLLHKLTGESDLAIGTPVANRQHPDLEQLIGLFVNTLVLRLRLDGNPTLSELMARTRATALAAYQHQQAPFEAVLDGLEIPRSRSRTPLFQVLFTLQNAPFDAAPAGDLTWTPMALDSATSKFDLSLAVTERDEGLEAAIEYRSELFRPTTIARFAELYCDLLAALPDAAERPLATISPLSFARREELDSWRRQEAPPAPEAAVHELFQQQAAATPKAVALVQDDREWTYQQLDVFANRLAHELRDAGVGAETPVGVWIQLTPETIGAILAILKAGGVYVPLDPALSDARLSQLCTSAGVERVVAASSMDGPEGRLGTVETLGLDQRGDALARQPAVPPDRRVRADRLAYVMFTSGSTGEPKGVATPHRGITRLVRQSAFARFDSDEVFLLAAPLSFDASTLELWGALLNGARLVLPPATATGVQSLDDLGTLVEQHGVSTLWLTAGLFQLMIDTQPERLTSLRQLLAGGDALSVEHLKRAHAALPRTQLINGYGPTEGTTFTCCHRFDAAELEPESALAAAPIGKPIAHTDIYVLDGDMERVPVGGIGELYLGGRGLARGYIDQPALTAERFLPNPHFDPRRDRADDTSLTLYRTGDRVRWRDDGVLEFLGRVDEQVKIRGFRVEPAEIEHALHAHPAVAEAVVIPIGEGAVERRLAAYLVPADALDSHAGKLPDATALRRFLLERLPVQLMPSAYVWLPALPLTANGKVDRGALPEPEWDAQGNGAGDAENEVERRLFSIWSDLLPASVLDRHSNFFDAGGDSIIALQIVSRAARQGLEITPAQLFQHQSVVELAAVAVRLEDSTGPVAATGDAPLTPIQRWFFSQQPPVPAHFNQAVLLRIPSQLEPARLEKALTQVTSWHDAFRLRFLPDPEAPGGWRQSYAEPGQSALKLEHHILSVGSASERRQLIERHADRLHGSLELDTGPLLRAALFEDAACRDGDSTRLLLVAHHLIIDGVSWRILLDDLLEAYRDLDALPPRPTASYQAWSEALCSREALAKASLAHWQAEAARAELRLPLDAAPTTARAGNQVTLETALDAQATQLLLQTVPRSSGYEVQDLLLTALASTLLRWCDGRMPTIDIEHHGRDASALDIHLDVSRTIGWFTAIYPFTPALELSQKPAEQLEIVSEGLRSLPAHGLGHGMLCYLGGQESLAVRAPVGFNYLGVLDDTGAATGGIRRLPVPGRLQAAANPRAHLLAINAFVSGECLTVQWIHDRDLHTIATVARLAAELIDALGALIDTHARGAGADPSASAFELAGLDADGLSDLLQQVSFGKDP